MSETATLPEQTRAQPCLLQFGMKAAQEVEIDGRVGLLCSGVASRSMEVDLDGEYQAPGSLLDSVDTWGAQEKPPVWYLHGHDPALGPRQIGWATDYHIDADGLHATTFVPRDAGDGWKGPGAAAARRRFQQVYQGIKSGTIRGYSVGGTFLNVGKALIKWYVTELTICPKPCLPSALFTVGQKAVMDATLDEAADPLEALTVQVATLTERVETLAGEKAVTKSEPDGRHPASHYLVIGDPDKVETWHLRYKNAQGEIDRTLCGACHAALLSPAGYRGNRYAGPDKDAAIAKLRAIYKAQGWDWPEDARDGKKAALAALFADNPDLARAALTVVKQFNEGEKAGKKHSKETLAAVKRVVGLIAGYFGPDVLPDTDADDDDDTGVVSSAGPAGDVMTVA